MDNKDIIMYSVEYKTLHHVQRNLNHYQLQHDESFFDYQLLKAALYRKHQSITNFLLKLGCRVVNPNETNSKETPLRLAMRLGNYPIIRKILNKGATIYDKDQNGLTPLHAAFKEKNYGAIDVLLNYFSSRNVKELNSNFKSLDPENKDDLIHFQIACFKNNLSAVNKYLSAGFDINSPFSLESTELIGLNPVHYTIIQNNSDMLNVFLKHNADLSIVNSDGNTPLQLIIYYSSSLSGFGKYRISQIFDNGNDTKYINSVDNHGLSHFHLCCITNSPTHVKVFIDKGVDINSSVALSCPNFPGFTPLHFAVMHGSEEVVKLLLKNNADFSKTDKNGETPLHLACKLPEELAKSIIKMLLDYKASTTALNEKGHTPLHTAFYYLKYEETKIFDMLISKIPWTVNFTDNQGLSHFHIVCARNYVNRVNDLLKIGVPVDSCVVSGKHSGFTALHFAVLYKQKDVVKLLLKWKAQVNISASEFKVIPLHLACSYNYTSVSSMNYMNICSLDNYMNIYSMHASDDKPANLENSSNHETQLEIINLLLLYRANVNAQDISGKTALFYICPFGPYILDLSNEITTKLIEIIKILLSHNANINAQLKSQESILHFITENNFLKNSEELIEFLISKGADIHAVDDDGFTPLHVAVKLKNKKLINLFLKHKANINAKAKSCKIPLQLLLEDCLEFSTENKDILLILLENGSDVNVKSKNDRTPWVNAITDHNIFILQMLLKYGADINMENSLGHSLLISALEKNRKNSTHFVTVKIVNILEIHILKLQLAGFYVSEEVRIGMTVLHTNFNYLQYMFDTVEISHKNFLKELDKMKITKIDNYTSLYNILQKDIHDISKHVRNSSLIEILENKNLDQNFPLYKDLLKFQFKKGLIRSDILESANVLLFSLSGLSLPDPCCYLIFKYLTNEDILNLKTAVHLIKDCKRKRVNDYSGTIEPLVKLQKKS